MRPAACYFLFDALGVSDWVRQVLEIPVPLAFDLDTDIFFAMVASEGNMLKRVRIEDTNEDRDAVIALASFLYWQPFDAVWGGKRTSDAFAALSHLTGIPMALLETIADPDKAKMK